jgi:protein TonB
VKNTFQNLILATAFTVSLLVHGILLLLHFVSPSPGIAQPADPGLEVILVNAKHSTKPLKAEALAQADLDGGGEHDSGRAKSPLPDLKKSENGDSLMFAKRRVQELEERQNKLLDQVKRETSIHSPSVIDKVHPEEQVNDGRDEIESSKVVARMAAEISQTIDDQNKRPRKTYITPSTQAVGYAMYYKALQKRIENIGTLNFPQHDGKKMYGELTVYIPIFQDGTIYEKEGGPRVERSSGNRELDAAALRIVRRSAPFGKFPPNMRSNDKDDLWVVITRFKFTRDEQLETELKGGNG